MRNVTEQITRAFLNGYEKRVSNSYTNGKSIFLWGNEIARKENGQIKINLCEYNTDTTRERLNGVLEYCIGKRALSTKQGTVYQNGKAIPSDEWVTIGE